MGCTASAPIPPDLQPMLVGTWINTKEASRMDPDLGGQSSPVRIKAIDVSDGNYFRRSGTSPWTQRKPKENDPHKVWVRLRIYEEGRVRYEQVNHKGEYFVLDFPVNAPWQREEHMAKESETKHEEENEAEHKETSEGLRNMKHEAKDDFEQVELAFGCAGVMEYVNCFGDAKARINYEYRPRTPGHSHSRLRITAALAGRSFTLVRERLQRDDESLSLGRRSRCSGGDVSTIPCGRRR